MQKINLTTHIEALTFEELTPSIQQLVIKSKEATELSHSPYSNFKVGCAILLENEQIVMGANQENAAYPICICAEGITLGSVVTQFPHIKIKAVAITAEGIENPLSPCGHCRQSFLEYEGRMQTTFDYYLAGKDKIFYFKGIETILPLAFKN